MSLLAVQGGATGTGTVTLLAPVTNTDRTLTLPDATGTVALQGGTGVGKVLQVVNATYSTLSSSSSSAFADTGLTASITPTSASSKILVMVNHAGCGKETNNTILLLKLLRNSTSLIDFEKIGGWTNTTTTNYFGSCSTCYLDSPSTTSATTYKTQLASGSNNATVYMQSALSGAGCVSTITLMEIAA